MARVFVSDLLKVKKLFSQGLGVPPGEVKVRQDPADPDTFEVKSGGEHYRFQIEDGALLDPSEYHQHELGYMHLWGDPNNSCPDHHRLP